MNDLQQTFSELAKLPRFRFERPATNLEIREIEERLHLKLPVQYRSFLEKFGCVRSFGFELYGIPPADRGEITRTTTSDCVRQTLSERRLFQDHPAPVPENCVVISTDGSGGIVVLYCVGNANEGQVHRLILMESSAPICVWDSLQEYLKYVIADSIEPGGSDE